MLIYKEIEKEDLASLAAMYVETFNAPPWNDAWTSETAGTRLRQMAEAETFYGICAYEEDVLCGMVLGFAEQFYDGVLFDSSVFETSFRQSARRCAEKSGDMRYLPGV